MDWSWAVDGVTDEVPRTTGPECINYMTDRRRWIEAIIFTILFILILRWAVKRLKPIVVPSEKDLMKPHSPIRLILMIAMTLIFGIEMGFKLSEKTVIFVLNPCHIQTLVQIYLLAAKPSKLTIAMFRIQMNNLNGPFLAFLFPEVECRTMPFEQATYWIQHALLYIIPVYILKSGAYTVEDLTDFNWVTIGVMVMLIYHFTVLNILSMITGINLNHMLCAAVADPFQGQNYRIAAVIHESILCPILNKITVLLFSSTKSNQSYSEDTKKILNAATTNANATHTITSAITTRNGSNINNSSMNNSNIRSDNSINYSSASSTKTMSNKLPLDLKLRKNILNTQNDNDNIYLYHQKNTNDFQPHPQHQQHAQHMQHMQHAQHPQHPQDHHYPQKQLDMQETGTGPHYQYPQQLLLKKDTPEKISLAEDIATATAVANDRAEQFVKNRFPRAVSGPQATSITSEYTMPTTKID